MSALSAKASRPVPPRRPLLAPAARGMNAGPFVQSATHQAAAVGMQVMNVLCCVQASPSCRASVRAKGATVAVAIRTAQLMVHSGLTAAGQGSGAGGTPEVLADTTPGRLVWIRAFS